MSKYSITLSPLDIRALDGLSQAGVVIFFCVPAGLAGAHYPFPINEIYPGVHPEEIARALDVTADRLLDETEATIGGLVEAVALIADERIRTGFMRLEDLLISYAVPKPGGGLQSKFMVATGIHNASARMLAEAERALATEAPEACDE